jgi:hypothetical protein
MELQRADVAPYQFKACPPGGKRAGRIDVPDHAVPVMRDRGISEGWLRQQCESFF